MKQIFSTLGAVLLLSALLFVTGCSKDEVPGEPSDAITLNMLNEANGKTLLGESDVYINQSNNFVSGSQYLLADVGQASSLGVKVAPQLGNLVREVAVMPGHIYQIFNKNNVRLFDSGVRALPINTPYYKVYVLSSVLIDGSAAGAIVKFVSIYPDSKGLPGWGTMVGRLNQPGEQVEVALPNGAECEFIAHSSSGDDNAFDISVSGGKLVILLNKYPSNQVGPWGDYKTLIRLGSSFTEVRIEVGMY